VAGIDDIMRLMDYENMRKLEQRLLTTEALDVKYGPTGEASQTFTGSA
jgi:hypothetical protein